MVPLMQYSREEWGITYPEYEMLLQAREQRIVDKRDIDRARYQFLWGDMTVREFISRADYRHTFETDIWPVRDTITQEEFEQLCYEVLEYMGGISVRQFGPEPGEFHFSYRSRSGKSQSGGAVYFDDHGEITGKKWEYNNRPYNDNTPICVGERIQKKVKGALYVPSII